MVKRVLPKWVFEGGIRQLRRIARMGLSLATQHQTGSKRAMAAALQFSEEIRPNGILVKPAKGQAGRGADIIAETADGQYIAREVTVFNTKNMNSLRTIIMDEAPQTASMAANAIGRNTAGTIHIREVFVQVTDDVLDQPDAIQRIREKAASAVNDLLLQNDRVRVVVVDSTANQIFP